jgi:hypothetical protein
MRIFLNAINKLTASELVEGRTMGILPSADVLANSSGGRGGFLTITLAPRTSLGAAAAP